MNKLVLEEALRRDAAWAKARGDGPPAKPVKGVFKEAGPEIKSIDEEKRTIWHKITSEARDRMGDIVRIDGLDTTAFRRKPAVLYGHDYRSMSPVPVIGENVGFMRDGQALYAGTKFLGPGEVSRPLADLVNDLWTLNKKKLMGWSVGFIPLEPPKNIVEGGRVTGQEYTRTELLEYSNVIIPANAEAVNDAITRGLVSKALAGYESRLAPEGPVYYYKLVDEREVDKARVKEANETLICCMRQLQIQRLDVAWFEVCDAGAPGAKVLGPKRGKAFVLVGGGRDPMVHLRSDLNLFDVRFAAAHELHHTWLERQAWPEAHKIAIRESAADAYAWITWYHLAGHHADADQISANWRMGEALAGGPMPSDWKKRAGIR